MAEAYIVAASRTAGGRKGGRLREWHPSDLAGKVHWDGSKDEDLILLVTGMGPMKTVTVPEK